MLVLAYGKNTRFSPAEKVQIETCPFFLSQVLSREDRGFKTSKIEIKGASFHPSGDGSLLNIDARVFYNTPQGKPSSYHVLFMPNAASLLMAFRVASQEATTPDTHIVMVREPRWGANDPANLQIPAGMLNQDETVDVASIRRGTAREFFEEVVDRDPVLERAFADLKIESLGTAATLHPAVTDKQYQFFTEVDVTPDQFKAMRQRLDDKQAGNIAEGEFITVSVMPIMDGLNKLLAEGNAAWSAQAIMRYALPRGLLTCAR